MPIARAVRMTRSAISPRFATRSFSTSGRYYAGARRASRSDSFANILRAMKIARTAEYEDLFARGYPHLRRLISPHPDEADAENRAIAAATEGDPGRYHVDWPAEVAYRYVRALANVGEFGIGFSRHLAEGRTPKAATALAKTGPVDETEGRALVAALLSPSHNHYEFQVEHCVFLLEAMIGTAALVDAVLGELEAMTDLDGPYSTRNYVAYRLGFAIRRLPDKARKAAEARVAKLVATKPESFTREFLSYLIGGREALEASERRLGLYCVHFCNDPALIRELAAESCGYFDASHVVLGGDEVLDHLPGFRKVAPPRIPWVIEEISHLASNKVEKVLAGLLEKKKYAARAQAALDLRAGKATKKPAAKKPATKKPAAKKPAAKKKR
jgi:hypothetical protein